MADYIYLLENRLSAAQQAALQAAALTGRAAMFLAVDCGNTYANALYGELGFAELARRRVMIRRCSELARK